MASGVVLRLGAARGTSICRSGRRRRRPRPAARTPRCREACAVTFATIRRRRGDAGRSCPRRQQGRSGGAPRWASAVPPRGADLSGAVDEGTRTGAAAVPVGSAARRDEAQPPAIAAAPTRGDRATTMRGLGRRVGCGVGVRHAVRSPWRGGAGVWTTRSPLRQRGRDVRRPGQRSAALERRTGSRSPSRGRARSARTREPGGTNGSSADASSAAFAKRLVGSFARHRSITATIPVARRVAGCERKRRLRHDLEAQLGHGLGLERPALREQLEEHDAERPDVGARVDVPRRAHLLGRHVERRAEHRARSREPGHFAARSPRIGLRHAEVEHLDLRRAADGAREKQVLRLEIAVHDARGVRLGDGLARLQDPVGGRVDRQRTAARLRILPRSLPSRNSMTMYGAPDSSLPTSSTRATCSLLSLTAARASRRNR